MKHKIISALPTVFFLRPSDYSRFVTEVDASQMMANTWCGVGSQLKKSMLKVGRDVDKKQPQKA